MKSPKKDKNIANKMLISMGLGIVVGVAVMILRTFLTKNGYENIWDGIYKIFFADITQPENNTAIGILFIIKTLFINALQFAIVPLVLTSISTSLCSLTDTAKLGRIAYKGLLGFLFFYVIGCVFAIIASVISIRTGFFTANPDLINATADGVTEYTVKNPLSIIVETIPKNLFGVMTNNSTIISVIFIAVVLGLCMNFYSEELSFIQSLMDDLSTIVNKYLDFVVNIAGPFCIFCMLVYTFGAFGLGQITPLLRYMGVTFVVLIFYLIVIYPLIVGLYCKVNPFKFILKHAKVALWAFATNSSAASLPLNRSTTVNELGVSEEVADFVLPLGMTINMNGTSIEHIIAVSFIATAADFEIAPLTFITMMLLAIGSSAGTPAVPNAGTVMIYATLTGAGFASEACIFLYTLLLTLNKPIDMTVVMLNVVGDSATSCLVSESEKTLNKEVFNS